MIKQYSHPRRSVFVRCLSLLTYLADNVENERSIGKRCKRKLTHPNAKCFVFPIRDLPCCITILSTMYLWSGLIPSNTLGYALTVISHGVITLLLLVIKPSRSSTCCVDQCTDVVKPQKRWPLLRLLDLTLNILLLFGALTMPRTKLPSRESRSVLHIGSAPSGIATYTSGASHMHKHGMSYIGCPSTSATHC